MLDQSGVVCHSEQFAYLQLALSLYVNGSALPINLMVIMGVVLLNLLTLFIPESL